MLRGFTVHVHVSTCKSPCLIAEFNYSYHSDYCRDWDNYDKYGTNKGAGPIDYSENYTSPYGSNTSGYDYTTAAYGNETDNYTTTAAYGYEKSKFFTTYRTP